MTCVKQGRGCAMMRWVVISILACASSVCAQNAVRIDSAADESLLSVRADSQGRLFVGGREALFVYEPNGQDGYLARKLLYRFPANSQVNDLEIRGNNLYVLTRSALYVIPDGVRR